jgi:hypothetical protein
MGERGAYRILVGRPEVRKSLGRPRRRWEANIKMDLQEVEWGAWTGLIWLRIGTGGSYECGNEPSGSTKCGEFLDLLASQEVLCSMELVEIIIIITYVNPNL